MDVKIKFGARFDLRIEALGTINVGNRYHYYLEFHVHDPNPTAHAAA
jgi:hypothetical protein